MSTSYNVTQHDKTYSVGSCCTPLFSALCRLASAQGNMHGMLVMSIRGIADANLGPGSGTALGDAGNLFDYVRVPLHLARQPPDLLTYTSAMPVFLLARCLHVCVCCRHWSA